MPHSGPDPATLPGSHHPRPMNSTHLDQKPSVRIYLPNFGAGLSNESACDTQDDS